MGTEKGQGDVGTKLANLFKEVSDFFTLGKSNYGDPTGNGKRIAIDFERR